MAHSQHIRKFRTNPIELAIFSIVTIICVKSVYSLFYDHQSFRPAALTQMSANPVSESGTRSPSSVSSIFLNMEVKCGSQMTQDTTATKVRLTGPLCGTEAVGSGTPLMKTQIMNMANKFHATVFTDVNAGKFSTDYIPLNTGPNPIRMEFSYKDGKTISQELSVTKN